MKTFHNYSINNFRNKSVVENINAKNIKTH